MKQEIKLSDAIEAGWKIAPQGWTQGYGQQDKTGSWEEVCAVGAAILGARPDATEADLCLDTGGSLFPQLFNRVPSSKLPATIADWFEEEVNSLDVGDVIQFMNDKENRPGAEIVAYVRQLGY